MTVLAAIRQKRHSATRLGMIVIVWLTMLTAPCAMAMVPVGQGGDTVKPVGVHEHCPDHQAAQPALDSDCCCDQTTILPADALKPFKLMALVALPVSPDFISLELSHEVLGVRPRPPSPATSTPVYLVTQRLRI